MATNTTNGAGQLSGAASSAVRSDARLRIFYKPTINFRLPGSVGPPLILVGPGTGVAPFIGFLEQRRHLEAERSNMSKGDDDATMGLWRGAFELSEEDLPVELDNVESISRVCPQGQYTSSSGAGTTEITFSATRWTAMSRTRR